MEIKKMLKWALAPLALIAVSVGGVLGANAYVAQNLSEQVKVLTLQASKLQVKISDASVNVLTGHARFSEISLHDLPKDRKPMIRLADIDIEFKTLSLFFGPFHIEKIDLSKTAPEVNITSSGERVLNWAKTLVGAGMIAGAVKDDRFIRIDEISIKAGKMLVGPSAVGAKPTKTLAFPATKLGALGATDKGSSAVSMIRKLLFTYTKNALSTTVFGPALRFLK
jgi:hypothetical protein